MAGRPPKSIETLKLHGGYRPDRHGEREATQVTVPSVLPECPDDLDDVATQHWNDIVRLIGATGVLSEIDAVAMERCCRYWSLEKRALAACEQTPLDKNARCAAVAYGQEWNRAAAKLGLNPIDRMRLRGPKKEENKAVMARKRG